MKMKSTENEIFFIFILFLMRGKFSSRFFLRSVSDEFIVKYDKLNDVWVASWQKLSRIGNHLIVDWIFLCLWTWKNMSEEKICQVWNLILEAATFCLSCFATICHLFKRNKDVIRRKASSFFRNFFQFARVF